MASTRANYASPKQAGVLPVAGIPDRSLLFDTLTNLGLAAPMRLALAELGWISTGCARWSLMRHSATAAWAGWPPVFMESMATLSIASAWLRHPL